MLIGVLRWAMDLVTPLNFTFARDIDLPSVPSDKLAFSHSVSLPPLDIAELRGFIKESADNVGGLEPSNIKEQGVRPRPIPGMHLNANYQVSKLTLGVSILVHWQEARQKRRAKALVRD